MQKFTPPGSKSYTNRALPIAAMASGESILTNVLASDDTLHMTRCLSQLGVKILQNTTTFTVTGTDGKFLPPVEELYAGNSGTSLRFLTSMLALVPGTSILTGNERMQERPINSLVDALHHLGIAVTTEKDTGCPPVLVKSNGEFPGGIVHIEGKTSSQFISSLLMTAPYGKNSTEIIIDGDLVSKPYIDLTTEIMEAFGVLVENHNYERFLIKPQHYHATKYAIEPDASSASYFFMASVIVDSPLCIEHLGSASKQGDLQFVQLLKEMGIAIEQTATTTSVLSGKPIPHHYTFDMHHCSDMVPTMAAFAATLPETTVTITNVANIRIKETDRIQAMCTELSKLSIEVKELEDGLIVTGKDPKTWNHGVSIATYDDHRIAMSFGVLRYVDPTIVIENPACTAKTYPRFWDDLHALFGNPL